MLHQLIVQTFVAHINRGTLTVTHLTNRVFKMRTACNYILIPSFAKAYDSFADFFPFRQLIPNRVQTIFSSEVFCGFGFNLLNSSSIAPDTQHTAYLNPNCLAAMNLCQ